MKQLLIILALCAGACTPTSSIPTAAAPADCCTCIQIDTSPAAHVVTLEGMCSARHAAMPPSEFASTWMEGERRAATRVLCQSTCDVSGVPDVDVDVRELAFRLTPTPVLDAFNVPDEDRP